MSDKSTEAVTLAFLAAQQTKIISELADQRADMAVLLAVVQRLDGAMQGLLGEARALHGQIGRFGHRLRQVEAAGSEDSTTRVDGAGAALPVRGVRPRGTFQCRNRPVELVEQQRMPK